MGHWRRQRENWLSSEQHGPDDAAEAAFAQAFAALPAVEPSGDFVQRAVETAWMARARRHRAVVFTSLAASILLAAMAGAIVYGIFGIAGGWLLTTAAQVVTGAIMSVLMAATTAVEWWSAGARAGSMVAAIAAMPQGAAALVTIELVGVAALYTLQRLLRAEIRFRDPGRLCF